MKPCFLIAAAAAILYAQPVACQQAGLSYLALCNRTWPCAESLRAYDGVSVIRTGWLERSFGEPCSCADTILQDERPKEIRVHVTNGPCMRNRRCGRHEIFHGYTIAAANRAVMRPESRLVRRYRQQLERLRERLGKSRGGLSCYLSPVLEADINEAARLELHRLAGAYLPQCVPVDNPLKARCLPNMICEKHGWKPGLAAPCIADLDGDSALEGDPAKFLQTTKRCDLSFLWSPAMNCNRPDGSYAGEPSKRKCRQTSEEAFQLSRWLGRTFR